MNGQVHEGLLFARQAIEANPDYAGAHARLGHLLMDMGAVREAAAAYRRAASLDPAASDLRQFLHVAEAAAPAEPRGGEPHEGVLFALRAVEANPGYAGGYSRLGHMLLHTGAVDEAVLAYRKGAAMDPSAGDLQGFLAHASHVQANPLLLTAPFDGIHADHGHHEGIAFALREIAANPGYAGAHARLGHLLAHFGDRHGAMRVYERAVSLDPHAGDLRAYLAEAQQPAPAAAKLDGQRRPTATIAQPASPPAKRGFFRTLIESLFGS